MSPTERVFVWLGGGVFVASLAHGVLAYAILWGGPRPSSTSAPVAWIENAVLFGVFALHHSLLARQNLKTAIARIVPERLIRSVYVWIASLLFILVVAAWRPVVADLYRVTGPPALAFAGLQLAGLWFVVQAVRAIDPLELAGIRPPRMRDGLQMAGAYGVVRHPLYLGWTMLVFGAGHMTGDRFSFAVISIAYLILAVPWEEHSLEAAFGQEYARYKARVRWRIIPYVY